MDLKKIPLAPMPRVLIDLKGDNDNMSLFPEDQISEDVWDIMGMDIVFHRRFQLIDTVDQNVGEYVLNGHGRFRITREQQPFNGVCAPVVYHAEEINTILPLVLFYIPDTGYVVNKATKESNTVNDLLELGLECKELRLISGNFDTGIYASDNGEIKIRRNCRSWSGYEIVEEA